MLPGPTVLTPRCQGTHRRDGMHRTAQQRSADAQRPLAGTDPWHARPLKRGDVGSCSVNASASRAGPFLGRPSPRTSPRAPATAGWRVTKRTSQRPTGPPSRTPARPAPRARSWPSSSGCAGCAKPVSVIAALLKMAVSTVRAVLKRLGREPLRSSGAHSPGRHAARRRARRHRQRRGVHTHGVGVHADVFATRRRVA